MKGFGRLIVGLAATVSLLIFGLVKYDELGLGQVFGTAGTIFIVCLMVFGGGGTLIYILVKKSAQDDEEELVKQGQTLYRAYFHNVLKLKYYTVVRAQYIETQTGLSWKIDYKATGADGVKRDYVLFCTTSSEGITPKGDRTYDIFDLGIGFK